MLRTFRPPTIPARYPRSHGSRKQGEPLLRENLYMPFDPNAYGDEVAAILALDGNGERLMPLALGVCSSADALLRLRATSARDLFPAAAAPEAAMAGLYLYFSCLDEAHTIAQDVHTPDGSFWHAIMHRQEPDPGNAGYWFRRLGEHPVFPALSARALEIGAAERIRIADPWDPFSFIYFCEGARRHPGSDLERAALQIQRAEWQVLFHHCARVPEVSARLRRVI